MARAFIINLKGKEGWRDTTGCKMFALQIVVPRPFMVP